MTKPTADIAAPKGMSLAQKIALAGGAGAALAGIAAPQSAEAEILRSTTLPLSPPAQTATPPRTQWDVDGDGTIDFRLDNATTTAYLSERNGRFVFPSIGSPPGPSGPSLTYAMAKLATGFTVGSNLGTAFRFHANAGSFALTSFSGNIASAAAASGWAMGDVGAFGFKFTNVSGIHYGWGVVDIHGLASGQYGNGYTITEAWYNNTPGASIQVGDTGTAVPEIDPASAGSVMSLVMGSLAMLERRRKLRAADASPTTVSA